jgi:hypothetical protein
MSLTEHVSHQQKVVSPEHATCEQHSPLCQQKFQSPQFANMPRHAVILIASARSSWSLTNAQRWLHDVSRFRNIDSLFQDRICSPHSTELIENFVTVSSVRQRFSVLSRSSDRDFRYPTSNLASLAFVIRPSRGDQNDSDIWPASTGLGVEDLRFIVSEKVEWDRNSKLFTSEKSQTHILLTFQIVFLIHESSVYLPIRP